MTVFCRLVDGVQQHQTPELAQTTPEPPDWEGGARGKRALSRCKGGPERKLLVVKGHIKGRMQMKTTVVIQERDD